MRVIDLFAGCGGMSLGFENAGFDIVAAFDNWDAAITIYEINFSHPIYKRIWVQMMLYSRYPLCIQIL